MKSDNPWTPDELDKLEAYVERGWPIRRIALELTRPVPSVNSKVWRIRERQKREAMRGERRKTNNYAHVVIRMRKQKTGDDKWNTDLRPIERFETRPPPPAARLVPLVELRDRMCRCPVGRDGLFCGAPAAPDPRNPQLTISYCDYHANICYTGSS